MTDKAKNLAGEFYTADDLELGAAVTIGNDANVGVGIVVARDVAVGAPMMRNAACSV